MSRRLFAVVTERGPHWDYATPMEEHADWRAHADFMNCLVTEGFVLLAGPLEGTDDVLLVVSGESVEDAKRRVAGDVWVPKGLLRQRQITPWWVRLSAFDAT